MSLNETYLLWITPQKSKMSMKSHQNIPKVLPCCLNVVQIMSDDSLGSVWVVPLWDLGSIISIAVKIVINVSLLFVCMSVVKHGNVMTYFGLHCLPGGLWWNWSSVLVGLWLQCISSRFPLCRVSPAGQQTWRSSTKTQIQIHHPCGAERPHLHVRKNVWKCAKCILDSD